MGSCSITFVSHCYDTVNRLTFPSIITIAMYYRRNVSALSANFLSGYLVGLAHPWISSSDTGSVAFKASYVNTRILNTITFCSSNPMITKSRTLYRLHRSASTIRLNAGCSNILSSDAGTTACPDFCVQRAIHEFLSSVKRFFKAFQETARENV